MIYGIYKGKNGKPRGIFSESQYGKLMRDLCFKVEKRRKAFPKGVGAGPSMPHQVIDIISRDPASTEYLSEVLGFGVQSIKACLGKMKKAGRVFDDRTSGPPIWHLGPAPEKAEAAK